MKLHDAIRTDNEFREDVELVFNEERARLVNQIEACDPSDTPRLLACKAGLDAVKQLRLVFFKEELNRARPHRQV